MMQMMAMHTAGAEDSQIGNAHFRVRGDAADGNAHCSCRDRARGHSEGRMVTLLVMHTADEGGTVQLQGRCMEDGGAGDSCPSSQNPCWI